MKNGRVAAIAGGALLALASIIGPVAAGEMHDAVTPELGTVAILPAVSVNGDPLAEVRAEAGWEALYGRGGAHWMSPTEVNRRMAIDGAEQLVREVRSQIWRNGSVDAQTAAQLCRMLNVDAVLSLRVDRWETEECRGMVAMTASLSGAQGAQLWSASGHSGFGHRELPDLDAGEHPDHRTCEAYSTLLARWVGQMPAAMQAQDLFSSMTADASVPVE